MIVEREMDITTVPEGIILHGCNAQGVMGSGVARALRDKWPRIFRPYATGCAQVFDKSQLLGEVFPVRVQDDPLIMVINGITQVDFGADGKRYADIGAISTVVELAIMAAHHAKLPLYIPQIGALRGGLDWEGEVFPAIVEAHDALADEGYDVEIIVCTFKE